MPTNQSKKILVVDDSLFFRETLSKIIETNMNHVIVKKAKDPYDARDMILEFHPDLMICDVEMPKMNGVEFIKRLLPQYSIPVIVVSSVSDAVFNAMDAGAVDFICKPKFHSQIDVNTFQVELLRKIQIALSAKVRIGLGMNSVGHLPVDRFSSNKIIGIGASTGGTEALYQILKNLPPTMPGMVIVQHIPPVFSRMFAERLHIQTEFTVKEAENGDYIEQGKVIIAPGDKHVKIKKVNNLYKVEWVNGERVNGHCPSIDVLFESMAVEVGKNAVGVILTGMGYDGAKGLLKMRRQGARTIGQDEASCVVYGMPKVAYHIGAVERQTSLENIPLLLQQISR